MRAAETQRALPEAEAVVVGNLTTIAGMRAVAEAANRLGRFDAVIHNAAVGYREQRRETEDGLPGATHVLKLAEVLGAPPEEILGLEKGRRKTEPESPENIRLWRKLKQVEKLSPTERRQVLQLIESLVERNQLRREKAS